MTGEVGTILYGPRENQFPLVVQTMQARLLALWATSELRCMHLDSDDDMT